MKLDEYLRQFAAPLPSWLEQFRCGDAFNLDHFFKSRVVFYPGSGFDGHPVKVFGSTHSAHCFVYADYGMSEQSLLKELSLSKYRFRGYRTLARIRLTAQQVQSCGKSPRISSGQSSDFNISGSFGFVEILEREQGHDDCHGAQRLAVLFLGADGFAAFDAIFGPQHNAPPPFCIVLQDHGFGGNYDRFGCDGLLEKVANSNQVAPHWLLVARNTSPWTGFEPVRDVDGDPGGMHGMLRCLYGRPDQR